MSVSARRACTVLAAGRQYYVAALFVRVCALSTPFTAESRYSLYRGCTSQGRDRRETHVAGAANREGTARPGYGPPGEGYSSFRLTLSRSTPRVVIPFLCAIAVGGRLCKGRGGPWGGSRHGCADLPRARGRQAAPGDRWPEARVRAVREGAHYPRRYRGRGAVNVKADGCI